MARSRHIGSRFGKLLVIDVHEVRKEKGQHRQVMRTRCDCGEERLVYMTTLQQGGCKACVRCARPPRDTAYAAHPLYSRWNAMRARCNHANHRQYGHYGGRGIKVCARWDVPGPEGFNNFLADMGPCPAGMTLERVDVEKGYSPGNCVWAGWVDQGNNRRNNVRVTVRGETRTLSQWARRLGTTTSRFEFALRYGYSWVEIIEKVIAANGRSVRWQPAGTRKRPDQSYRAARPKD